MSQDDEIERLKQAIAAQEALRGILPDEQIEAALQALRAQLARYEAEVQGGGAIAQGPGAVAVGEHGRYVEGNYIEHYHAPDPQAQAAREAEDALQTYLERLQRECRILPLAALGGDETGEEEVTLDQVYIALDTRQEIFEDELQAIREGKITHLRELHNDDIPAARIVVPLPALEAVALARQAVILGDPGAGKSTFVKKLLEMQAQAHGGGASVPYMEAGLLPLLVVLRGLAPALQALPLEETPQSRHAHMLLGALEAYLVEEWQRLSNSDNIQPLREALRKGDVFLVLDGLDEVPQPVRPRVRRLVHAFRQAYPRSRLLLTSRIRSYTGQAVMEGLPAFTLRPFDKDKVRAFVQAWYNAQQAVGRVTREQAKDRIADLQQAALSPDLRELAANPMMLTTMAIIHQKETGLPKERVKLYDLAVDVLVRRWQKWKVGDKLSPSDALRAFLQDDTRLRPALEELAYRAHRQGSRGDGQEHAADLPRGAALEILEKLAYAGDAGVAAEFLDYVDQRAGLLVGRGGEEGKPAMYAFPHRTFQEYLAGCYLVGQRERLRAFFHHAGEGDMWDVAAVLGAEELYYNRRGFHELLNLAYGLCPADPLADEQTWRALLWSGQMAAIVGAARIAQDDVPNGGEAYLERLRRGLVALLAAGALSPLERAEAGRALAALGDPRFDPERSYLPARRWAPQEGRWVPETTWGFVRIPAGLFLMGSDPQCDPEAAEREQPQHEVNLPYDYWIARYPVTVAQWRAFVEATGYDDFGQDALRAPDNHPVRWVTWYNALDYARWLDGVLKAVAGRMLQDAAGAALPFWEAVASGKYQVTLPSEAEWEKAARGGLQLPNPSIPNTSIPNSFPARIYPWGDAFDLDRANTEKTGLGTTSAVGAFPRGASPYGVLDLSGNVWEWTRSLWGEDLGKPDYGYPYDPTDGRENLGVPSDVLRVLRGGSFDVNPRFARAAVRNWFFPDGRSEDFGFRVVVVPVSAASEG